MDVYHQAFRLFDSIGAALQAANSLHEIGTIYWSLDRPDSALPYLQTALARKLELIARLPSPDSTHISERGRTHNNLGLVFHMLRERDSAATHYNQALGLWKQSGDDDRVAVALTNLAQVFQEHGDADSASHYLLEGLEHARKMDDKEAIAGALHLLGLASSSLGEADTGFARLRESVALFRSVGDTARESIAMNNIGVIFHNLKWLDSAEVYYSRSLRIARSVGERVGEARTLGNLGAVYAERHDYALARAHYRQSLDVARSASNSPEEGWALANIGEAYLKEGGQDSAATYLRRALDVSRAAQDPLTESFALNTLGMYWERVGNIDSTMATFRAGLAVSESAGLTSSIADALAGIGGQFARISDSDSAALYFRRATASYARIGRRAGSDVGHISANERVAGIYGKWMLSALQRRGPADPAASAYEALAIAEKGRAQALAQLMGVVVGEAEGDLESEGRALTRRVLDNAAAALIYSRSGDTLITFLALPNELHVERQFLPSASVDTLVMAVRYGVAGEDATGRGGRETLRSGSPFSVGNGPGLLTPEIVLRALADGGRAIRREAASRLLPESIRSRLPAEGEIVIIPQGGLGLLPFGLLPLENDSQHVAGRWPLRYGPSLSAIAEAQQRPGLAPDVGRLSQISTTLVVGNPAMPAPFQLNGQLITLEALPGALEEGRAVADSLGGVSSLSGNEASETTIRARLPLAQIVHFATHGIAFSGDWGQSAFLAFAPDSTADGRLSIAEIVASVVLRAELVVLSACQTAIGPVMAAEGTMGLQRAMLAKGARSVLVSLWNVSDESTVFLTQRFYSHWLRDADSPSKSEALRRAEADVRAEARNPDRPERRAWADPFYWAAFQVVGAS